MVTKARNLRVDNLLKEVLSASCLKAVNIIELLALGLKLSSWLMLKGYCFRWFRAFVLHSLLQKGR